MGSFQNRIKNFERYYGVHLRSLRRSRRFMSLLIFISFVTLFIIFKYLPSNSKIGLYSAELEHCIKSKLEKYTDALNSKNAVFNEWPDIDPSNNNNKSPQRNQDSSLEIKPNDPTQILDSSTSSSYDDINEKLFLPFTGNGYIGLSIDSKQGVYVNQQKSLSLPISYNPLVQIYSESLTKKEVSVVEFVPGLVNKIQCYENNKECVTVTNTLYAHRTRPSIIVEEIVFNNPTKDSITFDIIQIGQSNWNKSKTRVENINNMEFTISSGIIDVIIDNKIKHLCISAGTTRLPLNVRLSEHEFNSKRYSITSIKYSTTFLSGKVDNLQSVLEDLTNKVIAELKQVTSININKLKDEHVAAWNSIWKSGFGISNSLATGALNGDQLNASIYYVLTNNRSPFLEKPVILNTNTSSSAEAMHLKYNMERCYDGFSTLHAIKLWKLPLNELEISSLNSLWSLTLQKRGCKGLIDLGAEGILQAILLSLGGLKFTNHHLDLNLNPRQIHRDYNFRNINYANLSFISVDVEVGDDNHASLYVTLNELIDQHQKFYACDAGCIDPPVQLAMNERIKFPVKLTNPATAILYISNDKTHIDELKHVLHVQEVDIAPPQDVNSIAIHKHGHQLAGLATLFWTLFVILIIIFHLFLFKLIYRELCGGGNSSNDKNSYSSYSSDSNKKQRYARTV